MKVISFVSQLSLTNVGKSGTHDRYLFFPKKDEEIIRAFFSPNQAEEFDVIDKETGKVYEMKVTFPRSGAECRIVKDFGQFVKDKDLDAGDEVILEKRLFENSPPQYYIDYHKHTNSIIFRYHRKTNAYFTWHPERFSHFFQTLPKTIKIKDKNNLIDVKVSYNTSILLRSDAKEETPVYTLDGIEHFEDQETLKMIILELEDDGSYRIYKPFEWKFHEVNIGGLT